MGAQARFSQASFTSSPYSASMATKNGEVPAAADGNASGTNSESQGMQARTRDAMPDDIVKEEEAIVRKFSKERRPSGVGRDALPVEETPSAGRDAIPVDVEQQTDEIERRYSKERPSLLYSASSE